MIKIKTFYQIISIINYLYANRMNYSTNIKFNSQEKFV